LWPFIDSAVEAVKSESAGVDAPELECPIAGEDVGSIDSLSTWVPEEDVILSPVEVVGISRADFNPFDPSADGIERSSVALSCVGSGSPNELTRMLELFSSVPPSPVVLTWEV